MMHLTLYLMPYNNDGVVLYLMMVEVMLYLMMMMTMMEWYCTYH